MSKRMILASLSFLLVAGAAQAQSPFGLELRGGAAVPTDELGATSLNTGGGFEALGTYRIMPHVQAYAGWDWFRFTPETPFVGGDFDVETTGYALGLQFRHPLVGSMDWVMRAGAVYNHIELEDGDDIIADSGHEFGWEAGAGLAIPVARHIALMPGVRYRTLSVDLDAGAGKAPVDLSYLTLEVGMHIAFGVPPFVAAR